MTGSVIAGDEGFTPAFDLISVGVELTPSGQASPLYNVSGYSYNQPFGYSLDDPLSFSTILMPGQTYDLSASAVTGVTVQGDAYVGSPRDSFSFVASVPEPASIALVILPALLNARPRRIKRCRRDILAVFAASQRKPERG